MSRKNHLAALAAILVMMTAAACGGGSQGLQDLQQQETSFLQEAGMEQLRLPAPSELERNASEVSAQRDRRGKEYIPQLSSGDNITLEDDSCTIDPMFMGTWRLSYAGWRFNLPDYGSDPELHITLNPEKPEDWSDIHLGLSNWESDRWDWFSVPESGDIVLPNLEDYISDDTEALYAVLLTDREAELSVDRLRFGGQQLPMARLRADKYFVGSGMPVNLSAKFSEAFEGSWVKTEIDPEGDGNWTDTMGSSSLMHVYPAEGLYMAGLRITDSFGNEGYSEVGIYVSDGAFDEHEDNDSLEQANPVAGTGFAGLVGNIGKGGAHADGEDWYSFSLEYSSLLDINVGFGGTNDFVFTDLLRVREGEEPELVKRTSKITTAGLTVVVPPGDYAIRIWDFKDTDTMDKSYELEMAVTPSEAPIVVIAPWQTHIGYQDLLEIDLGASYDPDGSIVQWELDLYGDGSYEHVQAFDSTFSMAYDKRPGTFQGMARVTDNHGLTAERSFEITIEGQPEYNFMEQEPNHLGGHVPPPAFDFTKMRGVLGDGTDYNDVFEFTTEVPGTIQFDIDNLNEESALLEMSVYLKVDDEWVLQDILLGDGSIVLGPGSPAGDYYLRLHEHYGSAMYDLSGSFTP
ncbi:hypothetical protein KDL44_09715 [bacterium]|nr:hypothetical protein [bacterium]